MNSPPRGPFPFRIPWSSFQKLEAIRKNHDCFSLPDHLNYIIIQPTNLTPKHVSKNHGHQMNPTGLSWFVKLDSPIHNFILRVMQSVKVAIACVFFKQTKPHTKKNRAILVMFTCTCCRIVLQNPVFPKHCSPAQHGGWGSPNRNR